MAGSKPLKRARAHLLKANKVFLRMHKKNRDPGIFYQKIDAYLDEVETLINSKNQ
jgi:hypothetical protein